MYDLHVHARTLKEHIFVLSRVGSLTVCNKFVFANNFDVLLRDVITDGVSFRFHLVGIGFVPATRLPRERTRQEEKRKEQFLHSSFKFYMMRLQTAVTAIRSVRNIGLHFVHNAAKIIKILRFRDERPRIFGFLHICWSSKSHMSGAKRMPRSNLNATSKPRKRCCSSPQTPRIGHDGIANNALGLAHRAEKLTPTGIEMAAAVEETLRHLVARKVVHRTQAY